VLFCTGFETPEKIGARQINRFASIYQRKHIVRKVEMLDLLPAPRGLGRSPAAEDRETGSVAETD
jgi:hypothetical protein